MSGSTKFMGVTVVKGIIVLEQVLVHCSTAWAFEKGILHHFKGRKHSTCREGSSGLLDVYIGTSRCDNDPKKMMEVDACFTMIDALSVDQSYSCVVFSLKMVADPSPTLQSPRPINAFHFMCYQKNEHVHLPVRKPPQGTGRYRLWNDVVSYIETSSETARFSLGEAGNPTVMMNAIVNCLWRIDGKHQRFVDAPNVSIIPQAFRRSTPYLALTDGAGHLKKKLPNISQKFLRFHANNLQ